MIQEDTFLKNLSKILGQRIEIIAFGIVYHGTLQQIDEEEGFLRLIDEEDSVILEFERIENFRPLES